MAEDAKYGLSRRDLEYHLRWMMRKMPKSSAKLPQFLGEVMITLIEKNNAALAKSRAEEDRAEADIKMNVLEPVESAYSRWIRSAFDQLFQKRLTAMALAVQQGENLDVIANALNPQSRGSGG